MEAASTPLRAAAPSAEEVLGVARRHYGERIIKAVLFAAASVSILITVGIVASLLGETIAFFGSDVVTVKEFFTGSVNIRNMITISFSLRFVIFPVILLTLMSSLLKKMILLIFFLLMMP